MKFTKMAMSLAIACCLMAATAFGEGGLRQPGTQTGYESYDAYYASAQPQDPMKSPSDKAPAPDAAAAPAAGGCGCDSCSKCDSCGCNSCDCCCKHKHKPCINIEDCCPLECEDQETCRLFDCCCLKESGWSITGWISGGIMANGHNPDSRFNGPVTLVDRDSGQLDQLYLVAEKTAAADNCGCFLGGRVDYFWGNDYFFTTAAGLDGTSVGNVPRWGNDSFRSGSSLPQAYVEVDYNDLKIKAGHFYTPIGYEVAPAKDNFFVTRSYEMQYAEPLTHTGVLASKPMNDNWSWTAGVVAGWNTFNADDRAEFVGGLTYTDSDWGSLIFMLISGDDSTVNLAGIGPFANRTMYSIVWTRNFTSRFTYVLQHDLGVQQDAATLTGTDQAEWYSINSYCFYKLNCCWTAGWRFEWFRDDDGFNVTGLRPGNPLVGNFFSGNFYETAVGLNYKPNGNLNIRPEIRYDWFSATNPNVGSQNPFNDNQSTTQLLYGIDLIYQF
jgi:hypothetical protein